MVTMRCAPRLHLVTPPQDESPTFIAQHHPTGLQEEVECFNRFGKSIRRGIDVIDRALGDLRIAHHRLAGNATEVIKHLVPVLSLEVESNHRHAIVIDQLPATQHHAQQPGPFAGIELYGADEDESKGRKK